MQISTEMCANFYILSHPCDNLTISRYSSFSITSLYVVIFAFLEPMHYKHACVFLTAHLEYCMDHCVEMLDKTLQYHHMVILEGRKKISVTFR